MQTKEIIQKLNVVVAEVNTVSGTVARDENDVDADAFTAGSVRYIDGAHLRPFLAARQATNRICRARGTRFLSGFAIPDESLDSVIAELVEVGEKVNEARDHLVSHWGAYLTEWEAAHPKISRYAHRFPKGTHAVESIGFSLSVYKIHPAEMAIKGIEDGIKSELGGLAGRVLEEIALDVRDTWNPKAERATQKIKGLLNRVAEKARTLSFLDGGRLGEVARFVETTIAQLPSSGPIEGHDFLVLTGLLGILSSPSKLAEGKLVVEVVDEPVEQGNLIADEEMPVTTPVAPASSAVAPAYAW